MDKIYLTKHFIAQEYICKEIYNSLPNKNFSFFLIDARILVFQELLRFLTNKQIIINNYIFGGKFNNRGLRNQNSGIGAKYSQHNFGRATDFDVLSISADDVRKIIIENWEEIKIFEDRNKIHDFIKNIKNILKYNLYLYNIFKSTNNKIGLNLFISTIEMDINWVHVDCRNTLQDTSKFPFLIYP